MSREAFVSIGRNIIRLNARACELVDNIYERKYVSVFEGVEDGKVVSLALQFEYNKTPGSFKLARNVINEKQQRSVYFVSGQLVRKYFGNELRDATARFPAVRRDDNSIMIRIVDEKGKPIMNKVQRKRKNKTRSGD